MENSSILFGYEKNKKKTFSQKVARFFEIVDYTLLIPTTVMFVLGLYISLCLFLTFELNQALIGLGVGLGISILYFSGFSLFISYRWHSRGELNETKIKWMWIWTIVYNIVPLGLMAWILRTSLPLDVLLSMDFFTIAKIFLFWLLPMSWYALVCILSILCIRTDSKLNNNNCIA